MATRVLGGQGSTMDPTERLEKNRHQFFANFSKTLRGGHAPHQPVRPASPGYQSQTKTLQTTVPADTDAKILRETSANSSAASYEAGHQAGWDSLLGSRTVPPSERDPCPTAGGRQGRGSARSHALVQENA